MVVPKEKVRAAQDPRLRRLITRVEFLNSNGYHEERPIPWESGDATQQELMETECRGNTRVPEAATCPSPHLRFRA